MGLSTKHASIFTCKVESAYAKCYRENCSNDQCGAKQFTAKMGHGKLEIIDIGQDTQAQVMLSKISNCYIQSMLDTNHSILPLLLIIWAENAGMKKESTPEAKRQDIAQTEKLKN